MMGPWDVVVIVVASGAGAFAAVAWVGALVCWIAMLQHLSGRRSRGSLMLHGMAAFDPANFTERGQQWQRWFVRCFAGFFVALFVTAGLVALTARR